jgi:hypothetical protein
MPTTADTMQRTTVKHDDASATVFANRRSAATGAMTAMTTMETATGQPSHGLHGGPKASTSQTHDIATLKARRRSQSRLVEDTPQQ